MNALGSLIAEGRGAVPPKFLTDMTVNRVLTRERFEIGGEFLDPRGGLDVFDTDDALYVIVYDPWDEAYLGSARLIPTTGPNLLRDAAPYLLEFGERIESPEIWELSRICAMTNQHSGEGRGRAVEAVVGELLAVALEVAGRAGVSQIVCVADDTTFEMLNRIGCAPKAVSKPAISPGIAPHVALIEVGELPLQRIRKAARVEGAVVGFGRRLRENG
jgi:acyl homoserine lactone synthase